MNYEKMDDNAIIERIRTSDSDAMDFLVRKYGALVRHETRTLFLIGGDADDIYQEGMIGLFKAIRDYKTDKGAVFSTFATLCIRRQLKTALSTQNRMKHQALNEYISLYADDKNGSTLADDLPSDGAKFNPEEMIIRREQQDALLARINAVTTPYERRVIELYLEGLSHDEIADRLSKNKKSVDNALQRVRAKLMR